VLLFVFLGYFAIVGQEVIKQTEFFKDLGIRHVDVYWFHFNNQEPSDTILFQERRINQSGKVSLKRSDSYYTDYAYLNDSLLHYYEKFRLVDDLFLGSLYYHYDSEYHLQSIETIDKNQNVTQRYNYDYDETGRIKRRITIDEDERRKTVGTYIYDANNNLIEVENSIGFNHDPSISAFVSLGTSSKINEYDASNNIIRKYTLNEKRKSNIRNYIYDESNRLVELNYTNKSWSRSFDYMNELEIIQSNDGEVVRHKYVHSLNGLLAEMQILIDDQVFAKYLYKYK